MDTISKVQSSLDSYCADKISQAAKIDARYAELWREIDQYLKNGGKRMRPKLVLLAYEAYKGQDIESVIPVAAAWEMLHSCLLIHDDIIDRDTVRHNHPNIAGRYQSIYSKLADIDTTHYALSAALLGGDLLLMSAYEFALNAPIESEKKMLALSYLNQAIFTVAGGELIDTDSVLYPINQSNPYSIAIYKTASYSLQMPLQCGAALAGAPAEELEKLSRLGLHAGVAFQLRDDLLGVFGESATTGKSNRSDIYEKKRTFLVHEALKYSNTTQARRILDLYSPDHALTPEEVEEVVGLLRLSGAKEGAEQTIENEGAEALDIIETLVIDQSKKEAFSSLINKLIVRTN